MRNFTISLLVLCSVGSSGFAANSTGVTAVYCPTLDRLQSNLKAGSQLSQSVFDQAGILIKLNTGLPGKARTIKTAKIYVDVGDASSWELT